MSVLAVSHAIAVEPLGGSNGVTDIEPCTDHLTAIDRAAGQPRMSRDSEAMMPHTVTTVRDQINLGNTSGSVLGGTGHNINHTTYDYRTIYPPVQPPSGSSSVVTLVGEPGRRRNESPTETYIRHLLAKGFGYPLWRPEPVTIPTAYRTKGIRLGDVGIVNERGIFEFKFNACLFADDQIDAAPRLPPSFVPFQYSDREVVTVDNAFHRNVSFQSPAIRKVTHLQTGHASRPLQFEYDCSAPDGAILVLPNGTSQTDFASEVRPRLLDYVREQALSWLESVYGSLDRAASLYLITGCNKCRNSYSNMPVQTGVPLTFIPTADQGDVVEYGAESPADITMRTFSSPSSQGAQTRESHENQSVFLRGYKISARSTFQERLRQGAIKISDIVPQAAENSTRDTSTSGGFPGANLFSWFLSQLTNFGKTSGSNPLDTLDDNNVRIESFPDLPEVNHPSDIINSYMLCANPSAQFAITHDDDWCSVLEKSDDALPDNVELLRRILRKYRLVQVAGCVTLVQKEDHAKVVEYQGIHSSSGVECVPPAPEPVMTPQASAEPEECPTVDEDSEQPIIPGREDVPDSASGVIGAGHEGPEAKIKLRVINPHKQEVDIDLLESNSVEELIVAANLDGKNAHPYYEGKKMLVGHHLLEYELSDGACIEMRIEGFSTKTIAYLKQAFGLNDNEIEKLHDQFNSNHSSGAVSKSEFYNHYGEKYTQADSDHVFDLMNMGNNGCLDVDEWVVAKNILEARGTRTVKSMVDFYHADSDLSVMQIQHDQLDEAKTSIVEASALHLQDHDVLRKADALNKSGKRQMREDRFDEAEKSFIMASELYLQAHSVRGRANALNNLGLIQMHRDHLDQAEKSFLMASELYLQISSILGQAKAVNNLGQLQIKQDRLDEAEESITTASKLYSQSHSVLGRANALSNLGELQMRRDRLDEAEKSFIATFELYSQSHSGLGQANTLINLGHLQMRRDCLDEAGESFIAAYKLYQQSHSIFGQADALSNLGELQMRRDRLDEAEKSFIMASELYSQAHSVLGQVIALNNLGELQMQQDRLDEAEKSFIKAFELSLQSHSVLGQADARNNLGKLQMRRNHLDWAEKSFTKASELYSQSHSVLGRANALSNLGELQMRQDRFDEAEKSFITASELSLQAYSVLHRADALNNLGHLQRQRGRLDEAEKSLVMASELYLQAHSVLGQANALNNFGKLQVQQDRLDEAESTFITASELYSQARHAPGRADVVKSLKKLQTRRR